MTDPAVEAMKRAEADWPHNSTRDAMEAAAREALKPIRELHQKSSVREAGFADDMPLIDVCILGVVDLVDVHRSNNGHRLVDGCCRSEWAEQWGVWHLVLDNPRPIPIREQPRCRGALGLWTPPADLLPQLQAVI